MKVISFCHKYRARPACTFMQSDLRFYKLLVVTNLDTPKNDIMDSSKINSKIEGGLFHFKKFGRFKGLQCDDLKKCIFFMVWLQKLSGYNFET